MEETTGRAKTLYFVNPKISKSHGNEPTELTKAPSVSSVSGTLADIRENSDGENGAIGTTFADKNDPLSHLTNDDRAALTAMEVEMEARTS